MEIIKKIKITVFLVVTFVSSLSGAVITVNDLRANSAVGDVDLGASDVLGNTVVTADVYPSGPGITDSSQTQTFTISGVTIDGVGSNDDQVVFSIKIEALGVTADDAVPSLSVGDPYALYTNTDWGSTGSLPGGASNSGTNALQAGEGIRFSYVSGLVNLGAGATDLYAVTFNGFDEVRYDPQEAGNEVVVSLDGAVKAYDDPDGPDANEWAYDLEEAQEVIFGAEAGKFYLGLIGFSVTVDVAPVPEPSTWAFIFGLSGFAFIVYRRKRQA